ALCGCTTLSRRRPTLPTRRSSDLVGREPLGRWEGGARLLEDLPEHRAPARAAGGPDGHREEPAGTQRPAQLGERGAGAADVVDKIGRAHVCTPVTFRSRMPSSAG